MRKRKSKKQSVSFWEGVAIAGILFSFVIGCWILCEVIIFPVVNFSWGLFTGTYSAEVMRDKIRSEVRRCSLGTVVITTCSATSTCYDNGLSVRESTMSEFSDCMSQQ